MFLDIKLVSILYFLTLTFAKCTDKETDIIADAFISQGGLSGTKCPKAVWLETYARDDSPSCSSKKHRHMNVMVVGGNKGFDCIGWAKLLSFRPELFGHLEWHKKIGSVPCGACDQCKSEYPVCVTKPSSVSVYCVEPEPLNVDMLYRGLNGTEQAKTVTVIRAAVNLHVGAKGTVQFPKGLEEGTEYYQLVADSEGKKEDTVDVPVMTIDELFRNILGPNQEPEVLTIDTEGYDALALLSAARSLATGRIGYLEFEYHDVKPWGDYPLEYIIDYLDNLDYDCFWASNNGVLFRVTGCYDWRYNAHEWSNLVCAHRQHKCWMDALNAHAYKISV